MELTDRQRQVLRTLVRFEAAGRPLCMREMAALNGVCVARVQQLYRQLQRKGYLSAGEGKSGRRPCRVRGLVVAVGYADTDEGRRLRGALGE